LPAHLGDLQGVGQAGAREIVGARAEHLGFGTETAQCRGVDDAGPVPLEGRTVSGLGRFGVPTLGVRGPVTGDGIGLAYHMSTLDSQHPASRLLSTLPPACRLPAAARRQGTARSPAQARHYSGRRTTPTRRRSQHPAARRATAPRTPDHGHPAYDPRPTPSCLSPTAKPIATLRKTLRFLRKIHGRTARTPRRLRNPR